MYPSSLSVFFPLYNELPYIESVLDLAETIIPELGFDDYEIIIVDDGSTDGSEKIVEEHAAVNPHVRLVRHASNQGYGAALRTGFNEARKEAVFYTDSDLPVDLADLISALPLLKNADLVIGYRIKRYETMRRAVLSYCNNLLQRWMFRVHVRDVNFSFKLVRREVLHTINLTARTGFIDGQLLAESVRHGFRIAEIPIRYTPRNKGRSKFDRLSVAWDHFKEMTAYWQQYYIPRIPVNYPAPVAKAVKTAKLRVE